MTDPFSSSPSSAAPGAGPLTPAEQRAAEQLWREHQPWLLGALQRRLRDLAEAQDVASETFSRAIGYRRGGAGGFGGGIREPRALLTVIAKRLLFTLWRRRELEQACLQVLAQHGGALAASPEERAVLLETLAHVAHALDGLPLKARQAFLLSQIDGLGYHDIAGRLGLSHSTVRRHMAEGFRRVALALASQEAGIARPARAGRS